MASGTILETGGVIDGELASDLTMANASTKQIASLVINPGVWLIIGQVRLATSANSGELRAFIELSSTTYGAAYAPASNNGAVQVCAIISRSSSGTVLLRARQDTGSANSASNLTFLKAVKIG